MSEDEGSYSIRRALYQERYPEIGDATPDDVLKVDRQRRLQGAEPPAWMRTAESLWSKVVHGASDVYGTLSRPIGMSKEEAQANTAAREGGRYAFYLALKADY